MVSFAQETNNGARVRTDRELSLDFLRVTEAAAISAARTMGQGDRKYSDQVAVEAMREVMDFSADARPDRDWRGRAGRSAMLFIGEEVAEALVSAKS